MNDIEQAQAIPGLMEKAGLRIEKVATEDGELIPMVCHTGLLGSIGPVIAKKLLTAAALEMVLAEPRTRVERLDDGRIRIGRFSDRWDEMIVLPDLLDALLSCLETRALESEQEFVHTIQRAPDHVRKPIWLDQSAETGTAGWYMAGEDQPCSEDPDAFEHEQPQQESEHKKLPTVEDIQAMNFKLPGGHTDPADMIDELRGVQEEQEPELTHDEAVQHSSDCECPACTAIPRTKQPQQEDSP